MRQAEESESGEEAGMREEGEGGERDMGGGLVVAGTHLFYGFFLSPTLSFFSVCMLYCGTIDYL